MRRGIKKKAKKIKTLACFTAAVQNGGQSGILEKPFQCGGFNGANFFFSPLLFGNDSSSKWHLSSISSQLLTTTNFFFFCVIFD